jgi:RimJ/RimL family protein N-acetyltransferase
MSSVAALIIRRRFRLPARRAPETIEPVTRELVLTTRRLSLTTWKPGDVDDLLKVHSDVVTMRFVRDGRPETRQETAALIDAYIAEHEARGFTKWRLADLDGNLVGRAGFGTHGHGRELGYTIRRELWRRGLATEIAAALVDWHRSHAPAVPLWAHVATENPASRRVLEKAGFEHLADEGYKGLPCHVFRLAEPHGPTLGCQP